MDELSFGVAVGSFFALVAMGALALYFILRDRSEDGPDSLEWQLELRRTLGASTQQSGRTVTASIDGAFVDFTTDDGVDFKVEAAIADRDMAVEFRDRELIASGDGWERLENSAKEAVTSFVRDGGRVRAGRVHTRAKSVGGAVRAAERLVVLSRRLSSETRAPVAGILRRVTSADDPGRVSMAPVPENAGLLTEPDVGKLSIPAPAHPLAFVTRIWAASGAGEDRVLVIPVGDAIVVVVADGAGGTGGGAAAAEMILARTQQIAAALVSGVYAPAELLAELDRNLAPTGGQAAAVIAVVTATRVFGACAGDVEAVLVTEADAIDLTREHRRKPLLGSGEVDPVAFTHDGAGTLLVATDGLFRYSKRDDIVERLRTRSLETAPDALIELVRLRSGDLQDDVGLVVCSARRDTA